MPYITWAWNCHGPTEDRVDPFDYDSLTREGFETFLERKHSDQIYNHYNPNEARENRDKQREERDKVQEAAAREEKRELDLESFRESVRSRKSDDKSSVPSKKSDDKSNSSSIKFKTRITSNAIAGRSIMIPKVRADNDPEDSDKDDDVSDQTPHNSARGANNYKGKKQGSRKARSGGGDDYSSSSGS